MDVARGEGVKGAFKLYPPWWRDRYLEEAEAITEDLINAGTSRLRITLNLSFGAIRARLSAKGMPREYELWANRARSSIVLATAPTLIAAPLMLTIRQVPAIPTLSQGSSAAAGHLASAVYLIFVLISFGLIATIIWGYGSLSSGILRQRDNGRRLRSLARAPGYAVLLAVTFFVASIIVGPHAFDLHGHVVTPLNGHPEAASALKAAAGVMLGAGWILSMVLLVAVLRSATLPLECLRSGKRVSATVSSLLWIMTGAAMTLSFVYTKGISTLHGIDISSVVLGRSLLALAGTLLLLSVVSTFGAVLASRSWRVTTHLAR
jgi:hypothetical protein